MRLKYEPASEPLYRAVPVILVRLCIGEHFIPTGCAFDQTRHTHVSYGLGLRHVQCEGLETLLIKLFPARSTAVCPDAGLSGLWRKGARPGLYLLIVDVTV